MKVCFWIVNVMHPPNNIELGNRKHHNLIFTYYFRKPNIQEIAINISTYEVQYEDNDKVNAGSSG